MLDRHPSSAVQIRAVAPDPLPVREMLLGKPVEEAAALLPRLFNLCRVAQATAFGLALDLPVPEGRALRQEIINDHVLRLAVLLPQRLDLPPVPVAGVDHAELPMVLFGRARFFDDADEFRAFLDSGMGIAPVLSALAGAFAPVDAALAQLPELTDSNVFGITALENSAAARRADHPVLRGVEAEHGRGPLWRVLGRVVDVQAVLDGDLPDARQVAPGQAVVPTARGLFALQAAQVDGVLTDLQRITPTDHMLAAGGMMDITLAALGQGTLDRARLVVDSLDPCVHVRLEEVGHA